MTATLRLISIALCLGLGAGSAGLAQEAAPAEPAADAATTEAPTTGASNDLSLGAPEAPADGPGTTYVEATFDAWEQRCMRTEDGANPCQLYQLLKDEKGNAVAEISMFGLPAGQAAAAGATIVAPLETLLTEQLTIAVDANAAKRYPFTWCAPVGCFSRVGFTAEEVQSFKRGAKATMTIVPVGAPDQKVNLDISLKGFTAGFEAVVAANAN